MTAQTPDALLHRGRRLDLAATPLVHYLARLPRHRRPNFSVVSSACHRRHIATWAFLDGYLCLVDLDAMVPDGDGHRQVGLAECLPWLRRPLRARWVISAVLRCPEGRLLSYAHHSFMSQYERDRFFSINRGRLVDEHLVLNPPPPIVYRIAADGTRVCVDGFRDPDPIPDPLAGQDVSAAHLAWGRELPVEAEEGYVIAGEYRMRDLPAAG